jgi:AraC-like DNA-binding protein
MGIQRATSRLHRLRRVALHIDRHLFEPIALADLAEVAAMSRFHLERVFAGYAGESPLARVRRLRLARARQRLEHGGVKSILTLALECGYESPEGFARAFKQQFGVPPSAVTPRPLARPAFTLCRLPARAIQYIPFSGRMDEALLPFDELRARALAQGIPRERRKGWAVHLSGEAQAWAAPQHATLNAALLSEPLGVRIPGLDLGHLPAGPYAVFSIEGSYDALPRVQIEHELAARGEWRIAEGQPFLRCFDNPMYLPAEHERRVSLYVPLARS